MRPSGIVCDIAMLHIVKDTYEDGDETELDELRKYLKERIQ